MLFNVLLFVCFSLLRKFLISFQQDFGSFSGLWWWCWFWLVSRAQRCWFWQFCLFFFFFNFCVWAGFWNFLHLWYHSVYTCKRKINDEYYKRIILLFLPVLLFFSHKNNLTKIIQNILTIPEISVNIVHDWAFRYLATLMFYGLNWPLFLSFL